MIDTLVLQLHGAMTPNEKGETEEVASPSTSTASEGGASEKSTALAHDIAKILVCTHRQAFSSNQK